MVSYLATPWGRLYLFDGLILGQLVRPTLLFDGLTLGCFTVANHVLWCAQFDTREVRSFGHPGCQRCLPTGRGTLQQHGDYHTFLTASYLVTSWGLPYLFDGLILNHFTGSTLPIWWPHTQSLHETHPTFLMASCLAISWSLPYFFDGLILGHFMGPTLSS